MQMYSVQSEKELLGMCWDCPRIACYTKLGLMMWTVSEPLTLFASIYTTPIKIDRATPYPRVPRILALGEVSASLCVKLNTVATTNLLEELDQFGTTTLACFCIILCM